ncbi:hypothetical protein EK904_006417 [Melospiza melodia maxima]|nr:hypothetical protein EK904_006417 [Melospiza melodia maxima]
MPNVHLTTCFGSVSVAITWLFVEFLLQDQCVFHLLAWPKNTNSPEGHFWVMPCRIPEPAKKDEIIFPMY